MDRKELESKIVMLTPEANSIISYWIECSTCHEKLTSLQATNVNYRNTPDLVKELETAVCNYHTSETTHDKFDMCSIIRTFECCVCKQHATTENKFNEKVEWVAEHLQNSGHRFFNIAAIA